MPLTSLRVRTGLRRPLPCPVTRGPLDHRHHRPLQDTGAPPRGRLLPSPQPGEESGLEGKRGVDRVWEGAGVRSRFLIIHSLHTQTNAVGLSGVSMEREIGVGGGVQTCAGGLSALAGEKASAPQNCDGGLVDTWQHKA